MGAKSLRGLRAQLPDINRARAEAGLKKQTIKPRECLSCGKIFVSEGSWNRRCNSCYKGLSDSGIDDSGKSVNCNYIR